MRAIRLIVVLLIFSAVNAHAQWTNETNPTLAGKAGIGVTAHTNVRLRIAEDTAGALSTGPFLQGFGSTTAIWWTFRLDSSNNLHLDRQSTAGPWAEGVVFDRDGDVGIGTASPTQLLDAVRDGNGATYLQVGNGSNGTTASAGLRIVEGGTPKAEVSSLSTGSTALYQGQSAMLLMNYVNAPMVFGTSSVERMRIFGNGNVSIGGPWNQARLAVFDYADGTIASVLQHDATIEANTSQTDYAALYTSFERIPSGVTNSGTVVGGQFEAWKVKALNGTAGTLANSIAGRFFSGNDSASAGSITDATGIVVQVQAGGGTVTNGKAIYISDTQAANDYGIYQVSADDSNYFAGNIVVGTLPAVGGVFALEVNGHANFNGTVTGTNIKAHYQDVAEWVPSTTDLVPGTVVILNRGRNNEVMASATAYDTTVAGVVSAAPGISLGVEGKGKEQVATTGRVKVHVDARVKPIQVGDLLVTSDTPGTAMRSEPMSINGRPFHQPGTIIGKALEPLEGGVGEILVLLSLQ
jgi:hypothetical protein